MHDERDFRPGDDRDWLDAVLEADAPPMPDAAFTAAVIGRLPPPGSLANRRALVLAASAGLAAVVAFLVLPGHAVLRDAIFEVFTPTRALSASLGSLAVVAALVWGAVAAARAECW